MAHLNITDLQNETGIPRGRITRYFEGLENLTIEELNKLKQALNAPCLEATEHQQRIALSIELLEVKQNTITP